MTEPTPFAEAAAHNPVSMWIDVSGVNNESTSPSGSTPSSRSAQGAMLSEEGVAELLNSLRVGDGSRKPPSAPVIAGLVAVGEEAPLTRPHAGSTPPTQLQATQPVAVPPPKSRGRVVDASTLVIDPSPENLPKFQSNKGVEDMLLDQGRYGPHVRFASFNDVVRFVRTNRPSGMPISPPAARARGAQPPGHEATQIFIGQLPCFVTEDLLTMCLEFVLGEAGTVLYSNVRRESNVNHTAGYALTTVARPELVERFQKLNRRIYLGRDHVFYAAADDGDSGDFQRIIARIMAIDAVRASPEQISVGYARACLVIALANPPAQRGSNPSTPSHGGTTNRRGSTPHSGQMHGGRPPLPPYPPSASSNNVTPTHAQGFAPSYFGALPPQAQLLTSQASPPGALPPPPGYLPPAAQQQPQPLPPYVGANPPPYHSPSAVSVGGVPPNSRPPISPHHQAGAQPPASLPDPSSTGVQSLPQDAPLFTLTPDGRLVQVTRAYGTSPHPQPALQFGQLPPHHGHQHQHVQYQQPQFSAYAPPPPPFSAGGTAAGQHYGAQHQQFQLPQQHQQPPTQASTPSVRVMHLPLGATMASVGQPSPYHQAPLQQALQSAPQPPPPAYGHGPQHQYPAGTLAGRI
jgi:hypothetical protein